MSCSHEMSHLLIPSNLKIHSEKNHPPSTSIGSSETVVAGDEHGGGHRRAASSGKYSCDAPHRGSLARRILPSGKLHIWDAFFFEATKNTRNVLCQENSRFNEHPLISDGGFFLNPHFLLVTFPVRREVTRCIKWFKEGSLSFRSVCSTCPRSGQTSVT